MGGTHIFQPANHTLEAQTRELLRPHTRLYPLPLPPPPLPSLLCDASLPSPRPRGRACTQVNTAAPARTRPTHRTREGGREREKHKHARDLKTRREGGAAITNEVTNARSTRVLGADVKTQRTAGVPHRLQTHVVPECRACGNEERRNGGELTPAAGTSTCVRIRTNCRWLKDARVCEGASATETEKEGWGQEPSLR